MIDRTVMLLRLIATHGSKGARLSDLSAETGLPSPTVRRILKRLVEHGMVAQDNGGKRYTLGRLLSELGMSANQASIAATRYRPLVEEIASATGDTIYLNVRSGLDALCIDRLEASAPIKTMTIRIGDRLPLGVGAGGMALLAALPEADSLDVMSRNQPVYQRYPYVCASRIEKDIARTRADGYCIRDSPVTPGVSGLAMAIPERGGIPRAAITVASITSRLAEPRRSEILDILRASMKRFTAAE